MPRSEPAPWNSMNLETHPEAPLWSSPQSRISNTEPWKWRCNPRATMSHSPVSPLVEPQEGNVVPVKTNLLFRPLPQIVPHACKQQLLVVGGGGALVLQVALLTRKLPMNSWLLGPRVKVKTPPGG